MQILDFPRAEVLKVCKYRGTLEFHYSTKIFICADKETNYKAKTKENRVKVSVICKFLSVTDDFN